MHTNMHWHVFGRAHTTECRMALRFIINATSPYMWVCAVMSNILVLMENAMIYSDNVHSNRCVESNEQKLKTLVAYVRDIADEHACDHLERRHRVVEKLLHTCEFVRKNIESPLVVTSHMHATPKQTVPIGSDAEDNYQWEPQTEKNVSFADVIGGQKAIEAIHESIILPMKYVPIFHLADSYSIVLSYHIFVIFYALFFRLDFLHEKKLSVFCSAMHFISQTTT